MKKIIQIFKKMRTEEVVASYLASVFCFLFASTYWVNDF